MNEENKIEGLNTNSKSDFCSLVFSFDCYIASILEIETTTTEEINHKAAEYILDQKNLLKNLDPLFAHVYRKNPSCKFICVERISNHCVYNIYFDSFHTISFFSIFDSTLKFLTIKIECQSSKKPVIMILIFKNSEIRKKCARNIEFSYKDYIQSYSKVYYLINSIEHEFTYKGINLAITTEVYEILRTNEIVAATRENSTFKLRKNSPKIFEIFFTPDSDFKLASCFGFMYNLKNVDPDEMKLFDDFITYSISPENNSGSFGLCLKTQITYDSEILTILNLVSEEESIDMHCTADFTAKGVSSPIRVFFTFRLKIFNENQKFWLKSFHKVQTNQLICLRKDLNDDNTSDYVLVSICKSDNLKSKFTLFDNEKNMTKSSHKSLQSRDSFEEYEVVLSGTFPFETLITDDVFEAWKKAHQSWMESKEIPLNLQRLLRHGVPSCLRKSVWLMLVGIYDELPFSEIQYKGYAEKDSVYEKIIQRDITRTFTCHEYFKQNNCEGQNRLYRICKAYSNYDQEIGYCQGMSFIVANILLHMDELHSFTLLVQIMFKLGHRTIFSQSFDELQSMIYIFKRLTQTHIPDLSKHLSDLTIEPQMYIPQWFLTIFTSKFPLGMVDLCFDMFLSQGQRSMLQISLAMLIMSSRELLSMNFEYSLKYICSNIPKIYCSSEAAREVFQIAYSIDFSSENFDQLQIEFDCYKKNIINNLDPLELKKIENRILLDCQMRLEMENSILANNLVMTKIDYNNKITDLEHKIFTSEEVVRSSLSQICDLNKTISLIKESEKTIQLQYDRYRQEAKEVIDKKNIIIDEYKNICSLMELRENEMKSRVKDLSNLIKELGEKCSGCGKLISESTNIDGTSVVKISLNKTPSIERVENLEMELAFAKMKIAESEVQNESLRHQLIEIQKLKSKRWFES